MKNLLQKIVLSKNTKLNIVISFLINILIIINIKDFSIFSDLKFFNYFKIIGTCFISFITILLFLNKLDKKELKLTTKRWLKMDKYLKNIEKLIGLIGIVLFGFINYLIFFKNINYFGKGINQPYISNLGLLFIVLIGIFIIRFIYKLKDKLKKILLINACILFFIQVIISYNVYFFTAWDAGTVNWVSDILVYDGFNPNVIYFQRYPNNIFMLYLLYLIKKIGLFFTSDIYIIVLFFCCFLVNISVLMTSIIFYKITQNKVLTLIIYFLGAILIGISPWLTIPYTDVFGILFPVLLVYLYIKLYENNENLFLKINLIVFITILGSLIKVQVLIVFIAILITEALNFKSNENFFKRVKVKPLVISLIVIFLGIALMFSSIKSQLKIIKNSNIEFGMTHFLMMGLNKERSGVYLDKDVVFTESIIGKKNKAEKNIEEIKIRLKEFGFKGIFNHLEKKTLINFNDGTFAWGLEGNFYANKLPIKNKRISLFLRSFYYHNGKNYRKLVTIEQMIWVGVLFFSFINMFFIKIKKYTRENLVIVLSLIGVVLFSMLFEARARYLYLYSPIFLLSSALGFEKLFDKLEKGENK